MAELGHVVVRWSALEFHLELLCIYALHFKLTQSKPPMQFSAKIKFLRKTVKSFPVFVLRADILNMLETVQSISKRRNNLIHAIVVNSDKSGSMIYNLIKIYDSKYFAFQDLEVSFDELVSFKSEISVSERKIFNLCERFKSLIRLKNMDQKFLQLGHLNEQLSS